MKNLKKILYISLGFALSLAGTTYASQISVPSAPGLGYTLVSTSTGNYQATTTDPFHAGSFYATSTATSTFGGGINLGTGCFSIANTCITGGGTNYFTNSGSNTYLSTGTNLGIGTTTPWGILSVNNTAGVPAFAIGSSTGTSFVVDQNGNVGVGTALPTQQLQITKNILLPNSSTNNSGNLFFGGDTSAGTNGLRFFYVANSSGFIDVKTSNATAGIVFRSDASTGATERFKISSDGWNYFDNNAGSGSLQNLNGLAFGWNKSAAQGESNIVYNTSTGSKPRLSLDSFDGTTFTEEATLKGGSLGIATTSPSARLAIQGSGTTVGRSLAISDSTGAEKFSILDSGAITATLGGNFFNMPYVTPAQTNGIQLGVGDYSSYFWQNYGNLNDTAYWSTNYTKNNAGTGVIQDAGAGTAYIRMGLRAVNANNGISFGTGNGNGLTPIDRVVINDAGNVGIGTTSPMAQLSVTNNPGATTPLFNVSSSTPTATTSIFTINADKSITIGTTTAGCLNTSSTGLLYSATCSGNGSSSVGPVNTLQASDGAGGFIATGTPQLTVGNIVATSTTLSSFGGNITMGQLLKINSPSGNPEFDFQVAGATKSKTFWDTTNNILTFQNNANGSVANALNFINPATFTGTATLNNGFISQASSTIVGNATTTGSHSFGTAYIPTLGTSAGSFLAVDPNGRVIATTTPSGGLTSYDAFTHPASGISATTSQMTVAGLLSTASSTFVSTLNLNNQVNVANNNEMFFGGGTSGCTNATGLKTGTDGTFLFDTGSGCSIKFKGNTGGSTNWGYTDGSFNYVFNSDSSGNTTQSGSLTVNGSATSTFAKGINLSAGCFAIAGTCITGGGSGSGTVSSGLAGQLAWYAGNGTTVSGSSTGQLTVGSFLATSTTATSQIGGALFGGAAPIAGLGTSNSQLVISQNINNLARQLDLANINMGANAEGGITFENGNTTNAGASSAYIGGLVMGGPNFATAGFSGLAPNGMALFDTDGSVAIGATSANSASSSLSFYAGNAGGFAGGQPDMVLSGGSANLGLGTTSPAARFGLQGMAGGTIPMMLVSTSTSLFATSTALMIDKSGNLIASLNGAKTGIGTTTPAAIIDSYTTASSTNMLLEAASGKGGCLIMKDVGAGTTYTELYTINGVLLSKVATSLTTCN